MRFVLLAAGRETALGFSPPFLTTTVHPGQHRGADTRVDYAGWQLTRLCLRRATCEGLAENGRAMYSADDDFLNRIEREQADEQWRREVASRLDRYRGRRKKNAAAQSSLSFDFEQAEPSPAPQSPVARAVAERFQSSDVTCDTNYYRRLNAGAGSATAPPVERAPLPVDDWLVETDSDSTPPDSIAALGGDLGEAASMAIYSTSAAPEYDPDFDFDRPREFARDVSREQDVPSGSRQTGNLIHFPRASIRLPVEPPTVEPRPREELAEPISNPPRILDVPEEIIPTIRGPLFAEIRLDADKPQAEVVDAPSTATIELPLQVASLSQRTFAGLIDGLIVLMASAIFCLAVWKTRSGAAARQGGADLAGNPRLFLDGLPLPAARLCRQNRRNGDGESLPAQL